MDGNTETEELKVLEQIEEEVSEIKRLAPTPKRWFLNGVMQGMGVVVGSILAVMLLGWALSVFGLIPGFGEVVDYLRDISSMRR